LRSKPKKPSRWFWDPNHQTRFWGQNRETLHHLGFEAKAEETVAAGFKVKPSETITTGFEAKPLETVAIGFEVKLVKTVPVVLRPNHSQTVTIGFEA
jgi:hypothetical protein